MWRASYLKDELATKTTMIAENHRAVLAAIDVDKSLNNTYQRAAYLWESEKVKLMEQYQIKEEHF